MNIALTKDYLVGSLAKTRRLNDISPGHFLTIKGSPMNVKFTKYDAGKLDYSLVPPEVEEMLVEVLMHGAEKYSKNNWMTCEDTSRYYNAARRHMEDWRKGNVYDNGEDGSGLTHLAHALCNLMFLTYLERPKNDTTTSGD
jgi:hypothetical protein